MPIFVLAFIAAQMADAAALSPKVVSLAAIRVSAFSWRIYCQPCVVQRDRCYANKICRARDMLRPMDLIPRSLLANHFSKCVPRSQNWWLRICNSKGRTFIAWFNKLDIRYNSLSMAPDHQYALDDTINHSISDADNIVEFPNRLLYARTIYLTIDLCQCSELSAHFSPISEAQPIVPPLPLVARRPSRRSLTWRCASGASR